ALTIHVDGATFEYQRCVVAIQALDVDHLDGDLVIQIPREVQTILQSTPGVELPVHAANTTETIYDKRRAAVAHPGIVAGEFNHTHLGAQQVARILVLALADAHGDRL